MAHVVRPLIQWPWCCRHHSMVTRLLSLRSSPTRANGGFPFLAFFSNSCREVHTSSRAFKLRDFNSVPGGGSKNDDEASDAVEVKRSRNERKRDARRAVRWGMELSSFSTSQIKRILRVADLEEEVFEALMLVKVMIFSVFFDVGVKLGRDVREGKRRQFNYIGKLLREVEPQLMDGLIQATKDGDHRMFQNLSGSNTVIAEDVEEEDEEEEEEIAYEYDKGESVDIHVVTRWYDGLIKKDISIMNEVYSLREVEFDRQELRQLVRKVHSTLEREASLDENGKSEAFTKNARKSLTHFLQGLAKQLPAD
ncbi:kinesin heavy chain isolog [Striga asiatica]|uniref:Kinesin heavy chain isolog n=1 Tax=Striga asiatica TaxID=4170 RepID=A0A5A7P236_STRAF|nr:kinesin heavy chain isolog [Striga asiatica]